MSIRTSITFSLDEETITVDREFSTKDANVRKCPERGPFTLFFQQSEHEVLEPLRLRIISDADAPEIFANDRIALTTTVYAEEYPGPGSVSAFAVGEEECAIIQDVRVWEGISTVFQR